MAERDATFGQVVGGEFQGDPIARQNADSVSTQPSCQVRENDVRVVFELHTEKATGKLF